MYALTIAEIEDVSGGSEGLVNSCVLVGGAAGFVGAFFGPVGAAAGGLGGCVVGMLAYSWG